MLENRVGSCEPQNLYYNCRFFLLVAISCPRYLRTPRLLRWAICDTNHNRIVSCLDYHLHILQRPENREVLGKRGWFETYWHSRPHPLLGPDPGIVEVQKAGEECAPLSLGGDQIPVRASKYPEQLPGLAPHCLPYLCPLLSSHFRLLLQDEVYQVVVCSKCFKAADEQPRSDCIKAMRPRLGDLHLSASEWYAPNRTNP